MLSTLSISLQLNIVIATIFSTLYTSIPHDSLKHALKCLIHEAYKVRNNTFLAVRSHGKVMWSDVPSARQSFTEDELISHVEYLIDNI